MKNWCFGLFIFLTASQAFAENPFKWQPYDDFSTKLEETQTELRSLGCQFIQQTEPVVNATRKYVEAFDESCMTYASPSRKELQPVVDALISLQEKQNAYKETFLEGNPHTTDFDYFYSITAASDNNFSLKRLYEDLAEHWSQKKYPNISHEMAGVVGAFWKQVEFIHVKSQPHSFFEQKNLESLQASLNDRPPNDSCLALSTDDLYSFARTYLQRWEEQVVSIFESKVIVGDVDNPSDRPGGC